MEKEAIMQRESKRIQSRLQCRVGCWGGAPEWGLPRKKIELMLSYRCYQVESDNRKVFYRAGRRDRRDWKNYANEKTLIPKQKLKKKKKENNDSILVDLTENNTYTYLASNPQHKNLKLQAS